MRSTGLRARYWFAILALGAVVAVAPASAQSQNAARQDQDADLTRQQLAAFDNFLDSHPEVSDQIRKNPSLVNNEEFVEGHPALQSYLQTHPEVKEDLAQNPNAVMHQEQRYDRREDQDRDRDRDRDQDRDRDRNDVTRGELVNMDRFMDSHPEIAEQLRKDPSLVDNRQFVNSHPALQEFLANHPGVREEYKENPNAFMHQEERFDQRDDGRGLGINRTELANMDHFMDSHPEIAEQLKKDPSLVDNKQFVSSHPALQEFLANHPGVRQEMDQHPDAFMNREERYDRREDMRDAAVMDRFMDSHPEVAEQLRKDPSLVDNKQFVKSHPEFQEFLATHPQVSQEYKANPSEFVQQEGRFDAREGSGMRRDNDVTGGELSSFHQFLQGHGAIAGELSKNPSLATNEEYLENHPALSSYLQAHPNVHEELRENPQSFVKSAQVTGAPATGMPKTTTEPKMK